MGGGGGYFPSRRTVAPPPPLISHYNLISTLLLYSLGRLAGQQRTVRVLQIAGQVTFQGACHLLTIWNKCTFPYV